MDLNPLKKLKVTNLSVTGPFSDVESNSKKKLITKLNHDCLVKVLMYIPVLERLEMEKVCQKWKEATEMSWYNVKKLDLDELMIILDKKEEILKMLMMKCCRYLTHLTIIDNQYRWMPDVLQNNCRNIIHFSIDMKNVVQYKIPHKNLVQIITSMTKLKYLKASMDLDGSGYLCDQILNEVPSDINEIHLITANKRTNHFNREPLKLKRFKGLHCLTLQGIRLSNATMKSILQNQNQLVKLDLSYCKFPSGVLSIFSNLKNLEHLILWKVANFDVNEIISIAHNCSKLKYFEFDNNCGLSYQIFCELKYLSLEHLNVAEIPYSSSNYGKNRIIHIADNWKDMKNLNLEEGLCKFSTSDIQEITKFKNLEYLNITTADSQSFINIVSNCLKLKELLVCFEDISEAALEKLTNLKKLEKLNFKSCRRLSGDLLYKITNNCKNLVELDLSACRNVTEASLIQVGKLKYLKKLTIDYILNVPNAMFDYFHELEYLSCHDCSSVTDEGIIKVLDNCQKLSFLNMRGTKITVKTFIHASNRQFVFKPLVICVCSSDKDNFRYSISSPYLKIKNKQRKKY